MLRPAGLALFVLGWALGCDGNAVAPEPPDQDRFRECDPAGLRDDLPGCAEGEVCLEGRCYGACLSDAACGPGEACSADGVCIATGVFRDAGVTDPCARVECAAPTVCHPISLTCVDCSERTVGAGPGEPGFCAGLAPICDVANGRCVVAGPTHCAPCNSDLECTDGTFVGACVTREVMGIREQVCLTACAKDGSCPAGLACDPDLSQCVPEVGVPCTNWRAAVRRDPCLTDAECAPLGATAAVYTDSCDGENAASDPPVPGVCLQPCGDSGDCFDAAGGQQCVGLGVALFCRVP